MWFTFFFSPFQVRYTEDYEEQRGKGSFPAMITPAYQIAKRANELASDVSFLDNVVMLGRKRNVNLGLGSPTSCRLLHLPWSQGVVFFHSFKSILPWQWPGTFMSETYLLPRSKQKKNIPLRHSLLLFWLLCMGVKFTEFVLCLQTGEVPSTISKRNEGNGWSSRWSWGHVDKGMCRPIWPGMW